MFIDHRLDDSGAFHLHNAADSEQDRIEAAIDRNPEAILEREQFVEDWVRRQRQQRRRRLNETDNVQARQEHTIEQERDLASLRQLEFHTRILEIRQAEQQRIADAEHFHRLINEMDDSFGEELRDVAEQEARALERLRVGAERRLRQAELERIADRGQVEEIAETQQEIANRTQLEQRYMEEWNWLREYLWIGEQIWAQRVVELRDLARLIISREEESRIPQQEAREQELRESRRQEEVERTATAAKERKDRIISSASFLIGLWIVLGSIMYSINTIGVGLTSSLRLALKAVVCSLIGFVYTIALEWSSGTQTASIRVIFACTVLLSLGPLVLVAIW